MALSNLNREVQSLYERDLKRLRQNLANELAADNLKEVGSLTETEYNAHVKFGVYVTDPRRTFPTSINMSSSVPGCTKWILDFLRRVQDEARLVTSDSSKVVKDWLVKVFTEVLPEELKKSLGDRRRSGSFSRDGASDLFQQNIRRLRCSLGNPEFNKIRRDCRAPDPADSSWNWRKWDEVDRECVQISHEIKNPPGSTFVREPPRQFHAFQIFKR